VTGQPSTEPLFPLPATTQAVTRRVPSARPLFVGAPGISIHADANEDSAVLVARVGRGEGIGAIHTVKMKTRVGRAHSLAAIHRREGGDPAVLGFDASCYSGKNRDIGARTLDRSWVDAQLALGVAFAYTDSPYLPAGDLNALESVLAQTAEMSRPVIAVLPLGLRWLTKDAKVLAETINRYGTPVAFVLEHTGDPLGVQAATKGLVAVLATADVPVVMLRCDLSAIGAVACGASMGAIGTRSGLRHLFPIPKSVGGRPAPQVSALVPSAMCYRRTDTIAAAMARAPDEQQWFRCRCTYCGDRALSRVVTNEDAYLHSMASAATLAEDVLSSSDSRLTWIEKCRHAQLLNLELDQRLGGGWPAPAFFRAWLVALDDQP
jgi:hypothetical protein